MYSADPEKFKDAVRVAVGRIASYPERGERLKTGSSYLVKDAAVAGTLAIRNFQGGILSPDSDIWSLPESVQDHLIAGPEYGHHCPMAPHYGCNLMTDVRTGEYEGLKVGGVCFSYPGLQWGGSCEIKSYPAMWKCREFCQRYGMDQAGPLPFAMELFEKGIITKEDTSGIELGWGNEHAVFAMLRQIAYREGFGDVLAEGSTTAAQKIGRGAETCLMTIKGAEILTVEPRVTPSAMGLGHITCPRGGDDLTSTHAMHEAFPGWARAVGWKEEEYVRWFVDWIDMSEDVKKEIFGLPPRADALDAHAVEGKAALTKWCGELTSVYNSLGLCLFAVNCYSALGPTHFAKLYSACTGWHVTPSEIMKAGERIFNLTKAYVVKEGLTRKDDDWPARFYEEPLPEGPAKGAILTRDKTDKLLNEYYELMGWDKDSGLPTREKLVELGLREVADELEGLGKLA